MNDNSIKDILKVIGDALSVICQRFNDRIAVEKVIEMLYSASRKESSDAGAAFALVSLGLFGRGIFVIRKQ